MNALIGSSGGGKTPAKMTSLEIADLVGKRHDNVRRTIETLAERGVITLPQIEEKPTNGRPTTMYVFSGEQGKRDSIIVVAQLSPEFTARLVDRWAELEKARLTAPVRMPRIDVSREVRLCFGQHLRLAKLIGLSGNQAAMSANRATVAMTGVDTLGLMGITHIDAPQNEALLTPTEIGRRSGKGSGQAVNRILCNMGLQQDFRDAKGHVYYELTDAGQEAGGTMQDTGKKHSTGTPIRQLKWPSSIIRRIQDQETVQ
ncbi:Rha family transcriptional regulator [Sphingobium sp. YR768]|uniref:Rha family transcriptional regulator n=1 Tax=Sphingobium sp. YR768 TaxID=1884365 RepID=UPI0008CB65F7|nr:Rha family transcriptional regulator [Sphingobium sp. YR768]SES08715.1 Phage regulatory protein Rha (Phage_pRha) [Sphingobium sp. YR768]